MNAPQRTLIDNFPAFTKALVGDYFDARIPVSRAIKLSRGTSRVISSLAEERFAELLVRSYPKVDHIYLDQRMSNPAAKIRKPDLTVVVGGQVKLMVDVKMDLNWKRGVLDRFVREAQTWMSAIRQGDSSLRLNARVSESRRETRTMLVSKTCEHVILLVAADHTDVSGLALRTAKVSVVALWPMKFHPNHNNDWSRMRTVTELGTKVRQASLAKLQAVCDRVLVQP